MDPLQGREGIVTVPLSDGGRQAAIDVAGSGQVVSRAAASGSGLVSGDSSKIYACVGCAESSSLNVAAAPLRPVFKWFHVSNLRSGTIDTCLKAFIRNTFHIDDLRCFRLVNGVSYSSFKVGIPVFIMTAFLIHLSGQLVREFQHQRSKSFRLGAQGKLLHGSGSSQLCCSRKNARCW